MKPPTITVRMGEGTHPCSSGACSVVYAIAWPFVQPGRCFDGQAEEQRCCSDTAATS